MLGKNDCGEFGEYLLPIYSGGGGTGVSAAAVRQNTFTTTFVIDNLDNNNSNNDDQRMCISRKKQDCSKSNDKTENVRHRSVVHIPIVNNNPMEDRVEVCERDRDMCDSSGSDLTTSIHKTTKTDEEGRSGSVKMYANEKRSNNSGAEAILNSDAVVAVTSGASVANKRVLSHNLATSGSHNKNIKNNQMMNNQKINKASYLDAVSSVNNNGHHNAENSVVQKGQVANIMTNKNNNIEKHLNNKFEVQKVKKKDGFLSRISSGLRFSFRGKKTPKGQPVYNYNQFDGNAAPVVAGDYAKKQNMKVTRQNNQDFVFIPLKDPTSENVQSFLQHEIDHTHLASSADNSHNNNHMLNSSSSNKKPPIPSKPPRPFVTGRPPIHPKSTHAQQQRGGSLSPPRDTNSSGTHNAYHEIVPANQLRAATLSGKKYHGTTEDDDDFEYGGDNSMNMGSEQKIGLIETNLDTHETIITGKTQSLMELGGPQSYATRKGHTLGPVSRAIINSKANKTIIGNSHHNNTLEIDSADASNGRPHKSMEFLLDKENHQQVLVSRQLSCILI